MTKEEALRCGAEIARLALHMGDRAAKAAQLGEDLREEKNVATEEHKAHMREHNRADRLATALREAREILGAKDGESVQDAARRCAQAVRPWRPISELVMDGRRVEVWYSDNNCCEQVFARDEVSASEIVSHFREIDPTKPEGVA